MANFIIRPEDEEYPEIAPGEFIFLLDRSGSMSGTLINLATEALILFIQSIPHGSYFNVVSFGSGFEKMYKQSIEYTSENMDTCI